MVCSFAVSLWHFIVSMWCFIIKTRPLSTSFHALIYLEYMKYLSLICYLPANELHLRHGIEFVLNPMNGQFITKTAAKVYRMQGSLQGRIRMIVLQNKYCWTILCQSINQSINQSITQSFNQSSLFFQFG